MTTSSGSEKEAGVKLAGDMSADSENVRETVANQLASLDDRLHTATDNVDMLADIQEGIGNLLATSGNSEAEIRQLLQEKYNEGGLRKETFQLVESMLDRYVTENVPTTPTLARPGSNPDGTALPPAADTPEGDDAFGTTTVIPVDLVAANSADSRVQVGSVLRDRFLLQRKVSGGSMGVVYKAMDRRLAEAGTSDYWVAVKVLSPQLAKNGQALRALQQEAAKGRCLTHPNIVRFIDLDRDDDLYFLIMQWLEGRTLADILDSEDASSIDTDTAFRIVSQIGDALDYAHRCGIVHADIKPGNIMMMPNGDAKLFDFGVARVRQQHAGSEFDPGVLGALTPAYSSMQVLTGEDPVAADDVFSLCCLLYRLIAGYRVFGPRNAAEASQEGMKPQRLTAINDSQWRAIKKGLSYPRITRFQSVREFIDALQEDSDEPFRVENPDRLVETEQSSGTLKYLMVTLALLILAVIVGYQSGYFDAMLERFGGETVVTPAPVENDIPAVTAPPQALLDETVEVVEDDSKAVVPEPVIERTIVEPAPDLFGPDAMLVDFSTLPKADIVVAFSSRGVSEEPSNITLREDTGDVVVDFVRSDNLSTPLSLRLEEVGFSGNRSPWAAQQYTLSDSGSIDFPAGQTHGRVTLTMTSDPLREADQVSTLRLREREFADSALAMITVVLEDDDQRAFESSLATNTVAFAASQASVRETDPVVQIDLVRFNPSDEPLLVEFSVSDITATEGEDYFAPGSRSLSFGPGQRSARLLIPLVQDAATEGDEAFVVELVGTPDAPATGVYRRVVVMIRDDESQTP